MDASHLEIRKQRARAWFEQLRDDVCVAFEALEDALPASAPLSERTPGALLVYDWPARRALPSWQFASAG